MKIKFEINEYPKSQEVVNYITKKLNNKIIIDNNNPQFIICVGGDGTLLRSIRKFWSKRKDLKFLAIHTGTLGFYSDFKAQEIDTFIKDFIAKRYEIKQINVLEVDLNNKKYFAINDFRIESIGWTSILDVSINDDFLEQVRSNGISFSTQRGSTAYNKSLGGSILWNTVEAFQMKYVAPISNNAYHSISSSIVFSKNDRISCLGIIKKGYFSVDNYHNKIEGEVVLNVKLSEEKINLVQFNHYNFTKRIRDAFTK